MWTAWLLLTLNDTYGMPLRAGTTRYCGAVQEARSRRPRRPGDCGTLEKGRFVALAGASPDGSQHITGVKGFASGGPGGRRP